MKAAMRDRYGGPEVVSVREVEKPVPITFHTVFGVAGAEPFGATRWQFDGE